MWAKARKRDVTFWIAVGCLLISVVKFFHCECGTRLSVINVSYFSSCDGSLIKDVHPPPRPTHAYDRQNYVLYGVINLLSLLSCYFPHSIIHWLLFWMHTYCGKIIMHKQKMIVNIVATQFITIILRWKLPFSWGIKCLVFARSKVVSE